MLLQKQLVLVVLLLFFSKYYYSQNGTRILPIGSYFRDVSLSSPNEFSAVFPLSTNISSYYEKVKDTVKRYSNVEYFLFQRELIELKTDEGNLWITPLLDISLGRSSEDSLNKLFQNTRGARIEGELGKKLFFSTAVFENQSILPSYARQHAQARGELYPNYSSGTVNQQNSVISGGARTKPFKEYGYDYAYAVGSIHWQVFKKLNVSWGNNQHFIGSGYRSLLWSDNSLNAMNLSVNYSPSNRWNFYSIKSRGLNLLRRGEQTSAEALYENKLLSMNAVYYRITRELQIGLVESSAWMREDSLRRKPIPPFFFSPLPGFSILEEATNQRSNSIIAFDMKYNLGKVLLYGQLGTNLLKTKSAVAQLGTRLFLFKNCLSFVQVEYNFTDVNAYTSSNPRIHFTNANLFQAHPMGNQVSELLFRFNYEFKNVFISGTLNYYFKQNSNYGALLPLTLDNSISNQSVFTSLIEVGYRINRAFGFEVFSGFRLRTITRSKNDVVTWLNAGIRTNINNHYFDF